MAVSLRSAYSSTYQVVVLFLSFFLTAQSVQSVPVRGRVFRFCNARPFTGIWKNAASENNQFRVFQTCQRTTGFGEKPGGFLGGYLTFLYNLRTVVIFDNQRSSTLIPGEGSLHFLIPAPLWSVPTRSSGSSPPSLSTLQSVPTTYYLPGSPVSKLLLLLLLLRCAVCCVVAKVFVCALRKTFV